MAFDKPLQESLINDTLTTFLYWLNNISEENIKKIFLGIPFVFFMTKYWKLNDEEEEFFDFYEELKLSIEEEIDSTNISVETKKNIKINDYFNLMDNYTEDCIDKINYDVDHYKDILIEKIDKIIKMNNNIEVISTKIMMDKSKDNDNFFTKNLNIITEKSFIFLIKELFKSKDNIINKKSKIKLMNNLKDNIIIDFNWDASLLELIKKELPNDLIVINEKTMINNIFQNLNNSTKSNDGQKTIIINPHQTIYENPILPSYNKNYFNFTDLFIDKILREIKENFQIKNIYFIGYNFNDSDSFIMHRIFDNMNGEKFFFFTYIKKELEEKSIKMKCKEVTCKNIKKYFNAKEGTNNKYNIIHFDGKMESFLKKLIQIDEI